MVVERPRKPRSVTLSDVAGMAGVSISTASKAINGRSDVAESTRARVLMVAEELGFAPNPLAQSLLTGRTGTVGIITHDIEGRFSIPLLMGVEDAFGVNRVSVLLSDARGDGIREQYHLRSMVERRVDGIIIVGARPDVRPSLGRDISVPVVYAYAPSSDPLDCSIVADSVSSGRIATRHLVDNGRRTIALISGDVTYGASVERVQGALAALREEGLEPVGGSAMYGSWSEQWGRVAMRSVLAHHPDVDGIVCGNDQIGRGVLDSLRDAGRKVPEEVSVVGHDNWAILVENSRPPMTSVDMNLEDIGRLAARRLNQAMEGDVKTGTEMVGPRLVVRSSSVA